VSNRLESGSHNEHYTFNPEEAIQAGYGSIIVKFHTFGKH